MNDVSEYEKTMEMKMDTVLENMELEQLYEFDSAINKLKSLRSDLSEAFISRQLTNTIERLETERSRIIDQYPVGKYLFR